jgi:hypothetical protein
VHTHAHGDGHSHNHAHHHEREIKPFWTSSSFLVYTGGLTVLVGGIAALGYLSTQYHGGFARTAWAFLVLFVLSAIAKGLRRERRWLAAGIFAFATVIAWGAFVGFAWHWFGWLNDWNRTNAFQGWSLAHLSLEFLVLIVALSVGFHWRFPFIALISVTVGWFFVTDFVSGGGWWTYTVSLLIGFFYLLVGTASRHPSAFWLHFVGGLLIGVTIYHWFHTSNFDYVIVLVASFFFVGIGYATRRSSWTVFGTIGFFLATIHYAVGSTTQLAASLLVPGFRCTSGPGLSSQCTSVGPHLSSWQIALAFGLLGFWLVLLGMAGRHRHRHNHEHAAPPAPASAE